MRTVSPWAKELVKTGLVAGLIFFASDWSWSQEAAPPLGTLPPAKEAASQVDAAANVPSGDTAPAEGSASSTAPSSPWAKVPPVTPLPRTGWFLIPPTGPGYYSLKDVLTDTYRQQPPKYPYPPTSIIPNSYFDADYRFLDDPNNTQFDRSD